MLYFTLFNIDFFMSENEPKLDDVVTPGRADDSSIGVNLSLLADVFADAMRDGVAQKRDLLIACATQAPMIYDESSGSFVVRPRIAYQVDTGACEPLFPHDSKGAIPSNVERDDDKMVMPGLADFLDKNVAGALHVRDVVDVEGVDLVRQVLNED